MITHPATDPLFPSAPDLVHLHRVIALSAAAKEAGLKVKLNTVALRKGVNRKASAA